VPGTPAPFVLLVALLLLLATKAMPTGPRLSTAGIRTSTAGATTVAAAATPAAVAGAWAGAGVVAARAFDGGHGRIGTAAFSADESAGDDATRAFAVVSAAAASGALLMRFNRAPNPPPAAAAEPSAAGHVGGCGDGDLRVLPPPATKACACICSTSSMWKLVSAPPDTLMSELAAYRMWS